MKLNIDFCDFPIGFSKTDNYFVRLLSKRFTVNLCDKPDYVIYSDYGHIHRLHNCVKIYYTEECWMPDFDRCDYALSFHYLENDRHYRLPNYVTLADPNSLLKKAEDATEIVKSKTKFCAFITGYADKTVKKRVNFFHKLSSYKHVDSAGKGLNNVGGPIPPGYDNKIEFLRPYKFHICFENNSVPGYTTEKLVNAMQARTLPIYWGDPLVSNNFNPDSFLNLANFNSDEALIEKIIELDQNEIKYTEMMRQPWIRQDQPNPLFEENKLLNFFERIVQSQQHPIDSKKSIFRFNRWRLAKADKHFDRT
ncbi:glycosyltransferase family 10 domain-containing protein [Rhodoferax sp.]|uniref:glycosyltransferase family 10 domain-containing protein n=1 Tax=Rhodoferax sp. TaxID=50421 RepID=UPI00374D4AF8